MAIQDLRFFDDYLDLDLDQNQRDVDRTALEFNFPEFIESAVGGEKNLENPTGIMTQIPLNYRVANEPDVTQVQRLGFTPNRFKQGIEKLFDFYQRFSPLGILDRGIQSLRNRIDTARAIKEDIARDPQGTINQVVSPRIMNMQPSNQDIARGGGRDRDPAPAPSAPTNVGNPFGYR